MKFTYKPEGAEPKTWIVKPGRMANVESEAIEKVSGLRWPEWVEEVQHGRLSAIHALLWVLQRREYPGLTYEQVVFVNDDCLLELDDDQKLDILRAMDSAVAEGEKLTPDQQELRDEFVADVGPLMVDGPEPEPEIDLDAAFDTPAEAEVPKEVAASLAS